MIGLGSYGETLTVLTVLDLDEQIEEMEEERVYSLEPLGQVFTPALRV